MNRSRLIDAVLFTTLVYVATIVVQVYQPATGGYFNLGESMIYLAALISSPLVAGVAGGVGAALADLSTGYAIFAPGTLVIKFIEGYVAGLLAHRLGKIHGLYKAIATVLVYTIVFLTISTMLWAGEMYIGPEKWLDYALTQIYTNIPIFTWILIAVFTGSLILYLLIRRTVATGEVYALAIAGAFMVLGYFLYQFFISNPITGRDPAAAIAEVPVNIGQVIVGIAVALPIASWLRKAGYSK